MKKCAICNKELNGGFLVEKECLEALKADRDKWAELSVIGAQNCQFECEERKELERLQAENARLRDDKFELTAKALIGLADSKDLLEQIKINNKLQAENTELKAKNAELKMLLEIAEMTLDRENRE